MPKFGGGIDEPDHVPAWIVDGVSVTPNIGVDGSALPKNGFVPAGITGVVVSSGGASFDSVGAAAKENFRAGSGAFFNVKVTRLFCWLTELNGSTSCVCETDAGSFGVGSLLVSVVVGTVVRSDW